VIVVNGQQGRVALPSSMIDIQAKRLLPVPGATFYQAVAGRESSTSRRPIPGISPARSRSTW
jgi:hypothetical protein